MRYILFIAAFLISSFAYGQGSWNRATTNNIWNRGKWDSVAIVPRDTSATNNALHPLTGQPVGDYGRIQAKNKLFYFHDSIRNRRVAFYDDVVVNRVKVIPTVGDLAMYSAPDSIIIVEDTIRGGVFMWKESGIVDNGVVFAGSSGYWRRVFDGEVLVTWFGAKGDGVTDDSDEFETAINRYPVVRWPKLTGGNEFTIYKGYIDNDKSGRTFIFDDGVVLDGQVVHLAVGLGPGIGGYAPGDPITWVENVRVIGKLATTQRVGTYYARNIFVDEIEIMKDSAVFTFQQSDGGSRGVHFYWGSKDIFVNKITSRFTKNTEPFGAVFIDGLDSLDDNTIPSNITINQIIADTSHWNGLWLYKVRDINIGDIYVRAFATAVDSVAGISINSSQRVHIGRATVDGLYSLPEAFNLQYDYSNGVTVGEFTSLNPKLRDVSNVGTSNITIGYRSPLTFNTNPYLDSNYNAVNKVYRAFMPASGQHYSGEFVYNRTPGSRVSGWRCTVSGSPGTWVQEYLNDQLSPLEVFTSGSYAIGNFRATTGGVLDFYKSSDLIGEIGFESESGGQASRFKLYINNGSGSQEAIRVTSAANVGFGTTSPTAKVDVNGVNGYDQFRLRTQYTPTSSADSNGNTGDVAVDDNYIYYKTSTGWKRSALTAF